MGDIIERNQTPEPSEASKVDAFGDGMQTFSAAAVEVPSYTPRRTISQLLRGDLGFIPVLLTLIIVVVYFAIVSGGIFLNPENLSNLVGGQIGSIGILGLGSILVLLLGEIDLSVASVSVLCAVIMAVLAQRGSTPTWVAILAALLVGAIIGFINGIFVAVLRVPSFIVTLAGSIGYAGLLLHLLNGQATLPINNDFINAIAGSAESFLPNSLGIGLPAIAVILYATGLIYSYVRRRRSGLRTMSPTRLIIQIVLVVVLGIGAVAVFESYQGIPYPTALLVGLIILFWLILTKTAFGRHIYAVGGNAEAARRAGINVVGIRIAAFTLCSVLAAVAGIVAASRTNSVASQIDPTLLLNAIAAAVIGGVSLFGGRGSAWAIVLGVLIIGSLVNGLALLSQGTDVSEMVEGIVLLIAVTFDAVVRRLQARTGR
ncbi:MAG TPA: inner-membrane translocator [Ktedonobacteraceae bacterium]|nr:inner-membrane translocator [Ktedonobacteraceae bacterium]